MGGKYCFAALFHKFYDVGLAVCISVLLLGVLINHTEDACHVPDTISDSMALILHLHGYLLQLRLKETFCFNSIFLPCS